MATLDPKTPPAEATSGMDAIEMQSNPLPRYYTVLFAALVLWGMLFIGWFLFSGWSSQGEFADKMQRHEQATQAQSAAPVGPSLDAGSLHALGDKLYADNCAACHGAGGEGGIGPALNAATYQYGKDPAAVQASIAGGRPGGMPGFGNQLSPEQVEALVQHVTRL